jgi:hypothetical protein
MSSFEFGPIARPVLTTDRRREQRFRVAQGVIIEDNRGLSAFECTVRNLSQNGARLSFDDPVGLPAVFGLNIGGDSQKGTARVRWRFAAAVGVELTD